MTKTERARWEAYRERRIRELAGEDAKQWSALRKALQEELEMAERILGM